MAYITCERTSSSITLWLAGLNSDKNLKDGFIAIWRIDGRWYTTQTFDEANLSNPYLSKFEISDLASDTEYTIQCQIQLSGEDGIYTTLTQKITTAKVYIQYRERTPTSITVYLSGLNPGYGGKIRYVEWFFNGMHLHPEGYSDNPGLSNGIADSQDFVFTGLKSATEYVITCKVYSTNNDNTQNALSKQLTITIWTADEPYIQLAACTQSSIGVTLKALDSSDNNHILENNPKLKWWLRQENADGFTETTPKLKNGIYTFEGLENYTKYYVQCEILSSDERELYYVVKKLKNSTGADADGFRTMQSTPLLNFRSCTPNSITVYVTNLENAHYEYYFVRLYISTDGVNWGNYVLMENIGQNETSTGVSTDYTIENLSPSTTYHIKCQIHTSIYTWAENILTVTTQNSDGTGGGEEEEGGGDTPPPPVDPTVPVIEIVQRQEEFIDVRLTNITAYENLVWIYWYVSDTSFMGSFDNFYIEGSQWLKAGDTSSEEVRLNINFADRSICYINCVITNDGASNPDFSNPSSILCSNIVEVVSEYNNFYAIGGPDSVNDNIFRISSDLKRLTATCIVYNRSTGNYAEIYDTWHVNIYIDSYDNYITTFYQDEKDDFYGWVSPGLDKGIELSGSALEGYSGEHTLIAQAYFDTEWGEDGVFIGEKFETVNLPSSSSKPQNWKWTTDVSIGAEVRFSNGTLQPLTADEWNGFTARVNEFRAYKGLSQYSFTTVKTGTEFTAAIYNEAVKAIQEIAGYGTYLSMAVKGVTNVLSSYLYTSLETELNAIQ